MSGRWSLHIAVFLIMKKNRKKYCWKVCHFHTSHLRRQVYMSLLLVLLLLIFRTCPRLSISSRNLAHSAHYSFTFNTYRSKSLRGYLLVPARFDTRKYLLRFWSVQRSFVLVYDLRRISVLITSLKKCFCSTETQSRQKLVIEIPSWKSWRNPHEIRTMIIRMRLEFLV